MKNMQKSYLKKIISTILAFILAICFIEQACASVISDTSIRTFGLLWQYKTEYQNSTLWSVKWSSDGKMISATYFDNLTVILNSTTGNVVKKIGTHNAVLKNSQSNIMYCYGYTPHPQCPIVRTSAWSPDSIYLAIGGDAKQIFVYNTTDWSLYKVFEKHKGSVLSLDWSPDGRYLASASGTDKVLPHGIGENITLIWNFSTGDVIARLEGHKDGILTVKWSPDGKKIATASDDRTVKIWNTTNWLEYKTLEGHTAGVLAVDWSPDGRFLVTGGRDYTVRIWTEERDFIAVWQDDNCVRSVDWHPSGFYILNTCVDGTVKIRNATTGRIIKIFDDAQPTGSAVVSAVWSPDGMSFVTAAEKEYTVRVYTIGFAEPFEVKIPDWVIPVIIIIIIALAGCMIIMYPLKKQLRRRRR
jgi:WD40 repeat protein